MLPLDRLARIISVLTPHPQSTGDLKEKANLHGHADPVLDLLQAAEKRGEIRCHGKDERGHYLWSLPPAE